jgi:hypothetical protein
VPQLEARGTKSGANEGRDDENRRGSSAGAGQVSLFYFLFLFTYVWEIGLTSCFVYRPLTGRTHQVRLHLAHAALPIIGDALYGVDSGPVAESIEAFRKTPTGGGASREEREAAARRRLLFSSPSSASSSSAASAAASDDGADSSSDDSSAESPCSRLALHAWNVEALHPRALVPLRLAVDMPPDMSSLAKSLGLNVEYVTLGRAAEAAARAGGAGARNALRSERREAAKGRVRRMVARKGRSEE